MISWFFPRRHRRKGHKRRSSPGWPVCATHAAPHRTADAATNMSVTTLVAFAMHGVRHVSRRPVAGFVLRTSFQQDRCRSFSAGGPTAGSVLCRTYDIHLDQRARVLFGFKKTRRHGVFASWPRPPRCPRKAQTRHWPQGDMMSMLSRLFSSVARWSTATPGHFTSLQSVRIQSFSTETLL